MSVKPTTIFENATAFTLDVTQWGGRKKLEKKDLRGDVEIPPDTLASLGSKKIYDHKELRIFNTLKARAENLLKAKGVDHVISRGVFVVPSNMTAEVAFELRAIKTEFDEALTNFLANYDQKLSEWLAENEEWRGMIEGALETKEDVRKRISFEYNIFTFGATNNPELDAQMEGRLSGLTGRLFIETAQVAKESYERSFDGKDEVKHKALGRLKAIREKLNGFQVCSPLVIPIVEDIDRVLAAIPDNGLSITGVELFGLQGVLTLLKDPMQAMEHAEKRLAADTSEDPFADWAEDNGFAVAPAAAESEQAKLPTIEDAPEKLAEDEPEPKVQVESLALPIEIGDVPLFDDVDEPEDETPEKALDAPEQAFEDDAEVMAPVEDEKAVESDAKTFKEVYEENADAVPAVVALEESEGPVETAEAEVLEPEVVEDEEGEGEEEDEESVSPLSFDFDDEFPTVEEWDSSSFVDEDEYLEVEGFQGEFEPVGDFVTGAIDLENEDWAEMMPDMSGIADVAYLLA